MRKTLFTLKGVTLFTLKTITKYNLVVSFCNAIQIKDYFTTFNSAIGITWNVIKQLYKKVQINYYDLVLLLNSTSFHWDSIECKGNNGVTRESIECWSYMEVWHRTDVLFEGNFQSQSHGLTWWGLIKCYVMSNYNMYTLHISLDEF